MFETKAILVPSGEKEGDQHAPTFAIKATERSSSSGGGVSACTGFSKSREIAGMAKRLFFIGRRFGKANLFGQFRDRLFQPADHQREAIVFELVRRVTRFVIMRITERRRIGDHDRGGIAALPERPLV